MYVLLLLHTSKLCCNYLRGGDDGVLEEEQPNRRQERPKRDLEVAGLFPPVGLPDTEAEGRARAEDGRASQRYLFRLLYVG